MNLWSQDSQAGKKGWWLFPSWSQNKPTWRWKGTWTWCRICVSRCTSPAPLPHIRDFIRQQRNKTKLVHVRKLFFSAELRHQPGHAWQVQEGISPRLALGRWVGNVPLLFECAVICSAPLLTHPDGFLCPVLNGVRRQTGGRLGRKF